MVTEWYESGHVGVCNEVSSRARWSFNSITASLLGFALQELPEIPRVLRAG
jgi:hypothetical protein